MTAIDAFFATCESTGSIFREPTTGLYVRDRSDAFLIVEQRRAYADLLKFRYGINDVALDLGGAIGTFPWWALNRLGIGRVVSIEPHPDHQRVFELNWGQDERVTLIRAAVTANAVGLVNLYLGRRYSHCSSLTGGVRGRVPVPVDTVGFSDLLERVQPTVVKCDIEGGEHDLDWTVLPDSVTEVIMELHGSRSEWVDAGRYLDEALLYLGFNHVRAPKHKRPFNGAQMACWSRRT